MTPVILAGPEYHWECPNCDLTSITHKAGRTPFHACRGLQGLNAPLIQAGSKAKVEAVERGDYVGRELVQTDGEGRPIMSIVTTRDDGQDCAVLAPAARAERD